MGKLRTLSGKEVCAILLAHGFEQVRQRGSHVVMQKHINLSTITTPVPQHKGTSKNCFFHNIDEDNPLKFISTNF